jgi:hypothetical protein
MRLNAQLTYSNLISGPSTTGQPATSDRPAHPIFKLNATTFAQRDVTANSPTFRTRLILFSATNPVSSLLYYPFDEYASSSFIFTIYIIYFFRYSAEVFMFAEDAVTNETVGVRITKTRGIAVCVFLQPFFNVLTETVPLCQLGISKHMSKREKMFKSLPE